MAEVVLTDSCYWLGLVDPTDQHHETSIAIAELIRNYRIIFPWPCMYETISTHLAKNRARTLNFEKLVKRSKVELFDDNKYRLNALHRVFDNSRLKGYSHSLVDCVIREILKDKNAKVKYLITYNNRDFYDICNSRRIALINN